MGPRQFVRLGIGVSALMLSGCVTATPPSGTATTAAVRPPETPPATKPESRPSDESRALSQQYRLLQASLLGNDLLRTDSGEGDAPFDARRLAETFEEIAVPTCKN